MLKLKGNKGITLIALIITIIVLLILAGVTISAINGNENTMGKAKIAKEENEIANELEAIKLAITDAMAKGLNGKVSDVHLRESIAGIIDDSELNNISGEGPWTIKTKLGKTYEINGYGQIQESVVLEPTDIYVALDGNTLRFYSQKDNVSGTLYNDSNGPINFKDVNFTDYSQIPWNNVKTSITRASIEDVIVPTSTARWFNECAIIGVDHIENLKTNCVTDMNRMFRNCSNLESLDVSKFDTSNVTNMTIMFQLCSKLTTLDVSNFKTGKVENMQWMFNGCSGLTELDVSKWDTSSVTNMGSMFQNCTGLTELDLSNWDTSKVTDMSYFLGGSVGQKIITTIYVGDKWNTDAVTQSTYMFYNCNNLTGGQWTSFNSNYTDKSRAKIDGGDSNPGYLTHISEKGKIRIGDYIEYNVSYSNIYSAYGNIDQYSTTNGWRILDYGTKNKQGKYEGVKIISTGIPAGINFANCENNVWFDNNQTDGEGYAYAAAAGLRNNFKICPLIQNGSTNTKNQGYYTNIINNDPGSEYNNATGAVFLTTKADDIHVLSLEELNTTMNKINRKNEGDVGYRLPDNTDPVTNNLFKIAIWYKLSSAASSSVFWSVGRCCKW